MKILSIGNSFSEDTTAYVAEIAKSLGFPDVVVANLYIGGCPISEHYNNLVNDLAAYRYDRNSGFGWSRTPDFKISDAIKEEEWDWISIQHGSSFGGRYTAEESYKDLPGLVENIKALAGPKAKIAFNMAWVGEPTHDHPEMVAFGRDQARYFGAICEITKRMVASVAGIDLICPTGTAVQNARASALGSRLSRDGYHLSNDLGRYLAGLAFLRALTDASTDNAAWKPSGVDEKDKALIVKAVNAAMENPYQVNSN